MTEPAGRTEHDPHLPHACGLEVGGLGLRLETDSATLAAALRQRYAGFPPTGAPALTARVRLVGQHRRSALLDQQATLEGGRARFAAAGYEGFVDPDAGRAELRLSSRAPAGDVDYLARVALALVGFRAGGLLLHSAGIVRHGQAYLFFGPSGSGKSTVARLSAGLPGGVEILSDDLVLLLPGASGWVAHATPFFNAWQVTDARARHAPAAALLRLIQDTTVALEPTGGAAALAEVVGSAPLLSTDPSAGLPLLRRAREITAQVPTGRLHFRPEPSFWSVVAPPHGPADDAAGR